MISAVQKLRLSVSDPSPVLSLSLFSNRVRVERERGGLGWGNNQHRTHRRKRSAAPERERDELEMKTIRGKRVTRLETLAIPGERAAAGVGDRITNVLLISSSWPRRRIRKRAKNFIPSIGEDDDAFVTRNLHPYCCPTSGVSSSRLFSIAKSAMMGETR